MISVVHPTGRPNFCFVDLPGIRVWFSYETPIAFDTAHEAIASQNQGGATTGRHLHYIGYPKVPREEFERKLYDTLEIRP